MPTRSQNADRRPSEKKKKQRKETKKRNRKDTKKTELTHTERERRLLCRVWPPTRRSVGRERETRDKRA